MKQPLRPEQWVALMGLIGLCALVTLCGPWSGAEGIARAFVIRGAIAAIERLSR